MWAEMGLTPIAYCFLLVSLAIELSYESLVNNFELVARVVCGYNGMGVTVKSKEAFYFLLKADLQTWEGKALSLP